MASNAYIITMYSPMGPKEGTLTLNFGDGESTAEIDLMRHRNSFSALKTGIGQYCLEGILQTSAGEVPCVIDVQINETGFSGIANTSKGKMRVDGLPLPARGEPDEKSFGRE